VLPEAPRNRIEIVGSGNERQTERRQEILNWNSGKLGARKKAVKMYNYFQMKCHNETECDRSEYFKANIKKIYFEYNTVITIYSQIAEKVK